MITEPGTNNMPGTDNSASCEADEVYSTFNEQQSEIMDDEVSYNLSAKEQNKRRVELICGEAFVFLAAVLHLTAVVLSWFYSVVFAPGDSLAITARVLISVGLAGMMGVVSLGRCCFHTFERKENPNRVTFRLRACLFVVAFAFFLPLILTCGVVQFISAVLLAISGGAGQLPLTASLFCLMSSLVAPFVGAYGSRGLGTRVSCPLTYE